MKQTLSREHRKILEATVAQKTLRVRLRAHGRALGDSLRPDDTQAVDHLVTEIAYEHWHRMLFARFQKRPFIWHV
ncbi:hypothetical protein [Candidatus Symbiobacter mobilis]|uniref:Uncharacterized protein n=1 Tax=Candidatus Symbiobacter mobilis CR TaxID=946483 RepID=U5N7U8_9BURK|nr:hypothetical protein [Candidatus Symbiobacter mobilis]AGX87636.1 hypothetical protein Cenrod_1551 [Candidatus Symbiobacter mobilis CR]